MVVKDKLLKLSVSAIKTYEQCPRKYYYNYVERPDIEKKDWSHLKVGNFVHDVLDSFHSILQKEDYHEWPSLMTTCCKKFLKKYDLDKDDKLKAKEMLKTYLDKLNENGLPNVVATEQKFSIMLDENTLIRGFIDRIDDDDAQNYKYHLLDYKTGKSSYLDEFQLLVYGLYLKDKFPDLERFKGSYQMLSEDCKYYMPSVFTVTDLERTKEKILNIANEIRNDQTWEPKPQFLCKYCDYNKLCPSSPYRQAENGRKGWE